MLDSVVQFIEQSEGWVYVLAPLFMIVVAILPIPAEIPAMLNGMVFGARVGTAITWGGAVVGALISFELARRFGRPLAGRILSSQTLAKADRMALSAGWPGLLTLRFIPLVAFTALNWAAGLTPVRRWTFLWTTAAGILPGAIVFTVSGTGLLAVYRRSPYLGMIIAVLVLGVLAWSTMRYRRRSGASGP